MKGSLTLTNDMVFYEAAKKEFITKITKTLPDISNSIKPSISRLIGSAMSSSSTVRSLLSGKLKDDFGLSGDLASKAIINIIEYISKNITIEIKQSTKSGGIMSLIIHLPIGNVQDLVNIDGGSYVSSGNGKFSKGGPVDWMEWLLTKGTQVVIGDFWLYPYAKGNTRSGGSSVMLKLVNQGEPFRVDPNYAGTETDNFITRAIEPHAKEIMNIAADAVSRRFR